MADRKNGPPFLHNACKEKKVLQDMENCKWGITLYVKS